MTKTRKTILRNLEDLDGKYGTDEINELLVKYNEKQIALEKVFDQLNSLENIMYLNEILQISSDIINKISKRSNLLSDTLDLSLRDTLETVGMLAAEYDEEERIDKISKRQLQMDIFEQQDTFNNEEEDK